MKKLNIAFLIIILLSTVTYSQRIHSYMRPVDSLSSVKNGAFSSTEAGFSIDLPKRIGGFNGTNGIQYSWRLAEGYYFVGIETREEIVENTDTFVSETRKLATELFKSIGRELFETKVELINITSKDFRFQQHKGLEIRCVLSDTIYISRIFWIKNRAYKIAVLLSNDQKTYERQANTVFDSLKVLSPNDTDEIIRKKIEENTPQTLPQSPVVSKVRSDAEDENLKGKVKSVLQESQRIKGNRAGQPKLKEREDFYSEAGNWIKRISYDSISGLPFQIRVYGYIDGNRVEKAGFIHYESQPPAPMMPPSPNAPKRDVRYSMKFEYDYDETKKLLMQTAYTNDGNVWTKSVYTYKENTVENVRYQDKGKNSAKSIETLDENGNVIESLYFGLNNSTDWQEKSVYNYKEFDKQGNWTKRTQTFYRIINGVESEQWIEEEYRTITYY
jgi:hypothetical protein